VERIRSEQILGDDLVDARICEYRMECGAKPRDVLGVGRDEDVEILGRASQTVQVECDAAEDLVLDTLLVQCCQYPLRQLVCNSLRTLDAPHSRRTSSLRATKVITSGCYHQVITGRRYREVHPE
jgi:hypothetical protein